ncbi:thiamine transporter 1-like [Oratosquilla oratoria]|uniref:thiamine transporter 1-like n=1 Tax=Oratosquilla oratoria TaxID=337810 RepID=UPI003F766D85
MSASWGLTTGLLCLYGFLKEMRPSEPFLTDYLTGPHVNLTQDETYYEVYPVWTYSYLSLLIVVFLVTDLLRYKPVIIFEGFGYIITWSLLLWARGVAAMQSMEFFYGIATSTEVAYYTYIYAKVPSQFYKKVTSFTRAATLTGKFMSGILSQLLTLTNLMDYHSLNYVSMGSVCMATCVAVALPPVATSIYFHRLQPDVRDPETASTSDLCPQEQPEGGRKQGKPSLKEVVGYLWSDFRDAYSSTHLLKWSVWWAFATCGNYQIGNYIQPLWLTVKPSEDDGGETSWNGAVEAVQTLLSALAAFSVGFLHVNWDLLGEMTLAVISLLDGLLLCFMGATESIWVAYINYIFFRVSYQVLITVASFQVAKKLRADSYGLVFGINMFFSLLMQTILTVVVVDVLLVPIRIQFVIYGLYFCLLAMGFFALAGHKIGYLGFSGFKSQGFMESTATTAPEPTHPQASPTSPE